FPFHVAIARYGALTSGRSATGSLVDAMLETVPQSVRAANEIGPAASGGRDNLDLSRSVELIVQCRRVGGGVDRAPREAAEGGWGVRPSGLGIRLGGGHGHNGHGHQRGGAQGADTGANLHWSLLLTGACNRPPTVQWPMYDAGGVLSPAYETTVGGSGGCA